MSNWSHPLHGHSFIPTTSEGKKSRFCGRCGTEECCVSMVQGSMKMGSGGMSKKMNSAKMKNKVAKAKAKKKGNPSKHGKDRIGTKEDFVEEKILSKAIDQANEAKCAAKLLQSGGMLATLKDTTMKGKDINKEKRRAQVKKKLGRVAEKLKELKATAIKKKLV